MTPPSCLSLSPKDSSIITTPQNATEIPRMKMKSVRNTSAICHRRLSEAGALVGILLVGYSVDLVDEVLDGDRDNDWESVRYKQGV